MAGSGAGIVTVTPARGGAAAAEGRRSFDGVVLAAAPTAVTVAGVVGSVMSLPPAEVRGATAERTGGGGAAAETALLPPAVAPADSRSAGRGGVDRRSTAGSGTAGRDPRSPVQTTETTAAVTTNAAPRMRGSGEAGRHVITPAARFTARPTRVDQRLRVCARATLLERSRRNSASGAPVGAATGGSGWGWGGTGTSAARNGAWRTNGTITDGAAAGAPAALAEAAT